MSVVVNIINKNLSEDPIPNAKIWYETIGYVYMTIPAIAALSSMIVIILAGIHLYHVLRFVSHPSMQADLYWIVFLCPIVSICNSVGVAIPRTAAFLYSVGIVYFLLCIFVLVTLMTTLYGSRSAMCSKLLQKEIELNPRVFPLGCFFCCLPNIKPTAQNVRYLEWAVFQSPIIRVIIEIVSIAAFFEYETKVKWIFQSANIISFLSMIVASYSSYILMPAGCKQLSQYRFLTMFRLIDWAQFIYNVQKHVVEIVIMINPFGIQIENLGLGPTGLSQLGSSFLAAMEMLILSCLATFIFRPSKTAFFDKYPNSSKCENLTAVPTPSPNPFKCYPVLDPTLTEEEPFSFFTKGRTEKQESSMPNTAVTRKEKTSSTTLASCKKEKDPETAILSPAGNDKTKTPISNLNNEKTKTPISTTNNEKTPATLTPLLTPLLSTQSGTTNLPSTTTDVEVLPVEPTQEITDKVL